MRTSKLLTTLAIASVVFIAGCNNKEGFERDNLGSDQTLRSTTVSLAKGPVDLGTAGNYVILAKSGISATGTTLINGNIGVSPYAATAITEFGLVMDASGTFSTSALVIGKVYAADYAVPTPATLTTAVSDMEAAYTDAAGRTVTSAATTDVGGGTLTGLTLAPGVYEWGSAVTIPTDLTLRGSATDVWIFKVAGTLDMAAGMRVILTGGALPQNIFWQVAGVVTLGTTSHFEGIILGQTLIALQTGASINGRLLAQTAVTLDANAVTIPAFVPAKGLKSIKFGPIHVVAQEDIGSCNNVWAYDTFDKVYTITANGYGTYNVNVKYNKGTFVTVAGKSPGACESGDNGNMVIAGIKGTMQQEYNGTVTGTLIPGAKCTSGTCVDTQSILNILFNPGWSWTILSAVS